MPEFASSRCREIYRRVPPEASLTNDGADHEPPYYPAFPEFTPSIRSHVRPRSRQLIFFQLRVHGESKPFTKTIMPDITIKHLDEMERYTGSFQHGQQFFFAGKSLGLSTLGMNAIRMPPHWEHYPEHDHAADKEEELYIPLEGSGILHAEGQTYPMQRGVLIRVGAATKRKIVPGPEGMTLLVLSNRPDSA